MMQWKEHLLQEQNMDLNKDLIGSMDGKTGDVFLNHSN